MVNSPNFLNNSPQPPILQPQHKSVGHWLVAVLAIVGVVSFFVVSYYYALWPFVNLKPIGTPVPVVEQAVKYQNDTFGFSIELPGNWQGYTVNHIKEDIYDTGKVTANNGVVDSFQIIELHHPLETAENPREVMPVMVFTPEQWEHIQKEEWSVVLGRNSQWIMALPARYNYDFKPGWEEVDQLVHELNAFEPGGNNQKSINNNQSDTSTWKTYTNTEYGFEFKHPGDIMLDTDGNLNGHNYGELIALAYLEKYNCPSAEQYAREHFYSQDSAISTEDRDVGIDTSYDAWMFSSRYNHPEANTDYEAVLSNANCPEVLVYFSYSDPDILDQILATFKFLR
jgi:hypothetical protein